MLKRYPSILVWFAAILFLSYYLFNLYQLLSKSYYIEEANLYQVDTFRLLNRAYEESDFNGRYYRRRKLVFESLNGYSFTIDKNFFRAISDKKKLEDTLMYSGLKFTVYSDKEYYDKYKVNKRPIFIKVYQIQIGDRKYVDISKMNKLSKGDSLREVIVWPAFILLFGFLISKNIGWWTKRRVIIWCVIFLTTMIGLLSLT